MRTAVRLTEEQKRALQAAAKRDGITTTEWIRVAIEERLAREPAS